MRNVGTAIILITALLLPAASCKKSNLYSLLKFGGAPPIGYTFYSTVGYTSSQFNGYADIVIFLPGSITQSQLGNTTYNGTWSNDGNDLTFTAIAAVNLNDEMCTFTGTLEKNNADNILFSIEPDASYLITGTYADKNGSEIGGFTLFGF
jgi:hypothetical protein